MPQRVVLGFAFTGFLAWSLLVVLAWLLVHVGGDVLRLLAPVLFFGHPDGPTIVGRGADLLVAAGSWVVAAVWLSGTAVIGLIAFVVHRLADGTGGARFEYRYARWAGDRRDMRDVTPPDRAAGESPGQPRRRLSGPVIDQD